MVTIPYVRDVLEAVEQILHPKDKRLVQGSAGIVYSIQCKDCPMVYIGETGRRFEVRQKEHKKDLKQPEGVKYTRARRKESLMEIHQSALMDHITRKKHMIDWECETPGKGTRLEEEGGQRGHLHQEGKDTCNQLGWGAPPSSRSLLETVVPQDLVSLHTRSSDKRSSQS